MLVTTCPPTGRVSQAVLLIVSPIQRFGGELLPFVLRSCPDIQVDIEEGRQLSLQVKVSVVVLSEEGHEL